MNTEYVRKEEEEEEEEKEEERKEEGRSWRCARKTRTPHKGCGELMQSRWKSVLGAMLAQDDTSLKASWRRMTPRIDF